jgi:hypothetical protein
MRTTPAFLAASTVFLSLTLACGGGGGGGGTPAKTIADTLTYTDPVSTDFRLVKNSSSTASNLVLDLVGPTGTGKGVAFIFNADQTKVTWGSISNVAFNLGSGTQALVAKTSGNVLQAGAFQKPPTAAVSLAQPLMRFNLALKSGIPVNTSVSISVSGGNQLPGTGGPANISVAVGTLVAN